MRAPRRTQARTEIRMQYRPLGRSDLRVSHIGLGTMTWGEQNDEAQAHEQLDAALAAGVNFVDTAEIDRKSGVSGKGVSVRVDLGGRRFIKQKTKQQIDKH